MIEMLQSVTTVTAGSGTISSQLPGITVGAMILGIVCLMIILILFTWGVNGRCFRLLFNFRMLYPGASEGDSTVLASTIDGQMGDLEGGTHLGGDHATSTRSTSTLPTYPPPAHHPIIASGAITPAPVLGSYMFEEY